MMKRMCRSILLLAVPVLLHLNASGQKTDAVYFPNGDRLYGEIKRLDLGLLYLDTKYMGTEDIEWNDIQRIVTRKTFLIQTRDGNIREGIMSYDSPEEVVLIFGDSSLTVPSTDVIKLINLGQKIWDRFKGELGFGLNFTQANRNLNLNSNAGLTYRGLKYVSSVGISNVFSTSKSDEERYRKIDLDVEGGRLFARSWAALLQYAYEMNSELGFDNRHLVTGGIGVNALRTEKTNLVAKTGLAYNRESFVSGVDSVKTVTDNVEWPVSLMFEAFTYDIPEIDIEIDLGYVPSLTDAGRHRLNTRVTIALEFIDDFWINFTFYDNFDNRVPDTGMKSNDYGFTSGISYSFD